MPGVLSSAKVVETLASEYAAQFKGRPHDTPHRGQQPKEARPFLLFCQSILGPQDTQRAADCMAYVVKSTIWRMRTG